MTRLAVYAAVLLFACAASAYDKKANPLSEGAKKELAKLQGQWVAEEFGRYGKKFDVKEDKLVLEIKGTKWIFTEQEKAEFVAFDPTTTPKCVDLKSVEEARKGAVDEAIYKIDGDTLTICLHQGKEKQRPTTFETSPKTPDTILMVFKRVKKK